jgi:predicted RNA methylase
MKIRDRIKELRRVKASELSPNPRNWRTHPRRQQDALRGVLAEIGYAGGLIARELPDGTLELIDGHLRAETTPEQDVPVLIVDLDQDEANKLLTLMDPMAAMAEANKDALGSLMADMQTDSDALQAMLDDMAAAEGIDLFESGAGDLQDPEPQLDRAAELQEKWGTELGQLWVIPGKAGEHTLLCGDATKADMGDVAAVVTDPPYGVGIEYGAFNDTVVEVENLIKQVMPCILKAPCAALTPGVPAMWSYPRPSWVGAWVHPAPCGGCPWGFVGNNPILFYGDDPYLQSGLGRRADSIVMASTRQGVEGHPTPKPIKVWTWLVERTTTAEGQIVLDPFLGSGTTMVAAEQLGRVCYGIEIEPKYVAVALQRMKDLGLQPRLEEASEAA